MRRVPHDGQKPRPLHENATTSLWRHPSHHTRAKPCAKIPQRRNASTSRRQNRGTLRSPSSNRASEVAHSHCTARYRTVFSGSRRRQLAAPAIATQRVGPAGASGGKQSPGPLLYDVTFGWQCDCGPTRSRGSTSSAPRTPHDRALHDKFMHDPRARSDITTRDSQELWHPARADATIAACTNALPPSLSCSR
ncbi:MAG: hypothetical protein ACI8UD_004412 [Planctomycetota bacterium]|jgi:hypothetical protein